MLTRSSVMRTGRIAVIGAGAGGLAAAASLAARGLDVRLFDRAGAVGGKLRQVAIGGHRLDAGPTVLTMRWVFDELFAEAGESLDDHLSLRPIEILARHAWSGDQRLDLFADARRSEDAIAAFAGPAEGRRFGEFAARARSVYETLERPFLRSSRPDPLTLVGRVGLRGLPGLMRISPFTTLWSALGRHFRDPRLRQLFGRYATYCGSSPYMAPATLMLVAHVEQAGVWRVEGGMHRIADALVRLAVRHGASVDRGREVESIRVEQGRAAGVRLAGGETVEADAVIFAGDANALASGLLGAEASRGNAPIPTAKRSLSACVWNLVAEPAGFPLVHHNVFFSRDYRAEFGQIFRDRLVPDDPTVYLCAFDRDDDRAAAGEGRGAPERMMCLVNAPADGDANPMDDKELKRCERSMEATLARCGLTVARRPEATVTTTPADFAKLFPATGGALYGRASHGWMASFSRPGSRTRIPRLYLAGGSVHPGPGLPTSALSGRLAAASVIEDLGRISTRR